MRWICAVSKTRITHADSQEEKSAKSTLGQKHPSQPRVSTTATVSPHPRTKKMDAAFLLTVRSFLLTVELFYLQLEPFCLQLSLLYLQLELLCLQWESASNEGLKGLQAKKLNCKKNAPTVSKKSFPPPPPRNPKSQPRLTVGKLASEHQDGLEAAETPHASNRASSPPNCPKDSSLPESLQKTCSA